jgi:curved DNA-binding protein
VGYRDHYAVLGLTREATAEDIKRSYRKLARRYHPDVSREPDAEAKFKAVNEAYHVLGDPEKRRLYDRHGDAWKAVSEGRAPPPGTEEFRRQYQGAEVDPEDLHDLGSFFESLFGGSFRRTRSHRSRWQAVGPDYESELELAIEEAYRGGRREVHLVDPGSGRLRRYQVEIPPGVRDGQRIRLARQGGEGIGGGPSGDLYLRIRMRASRDFRLEGDDLVTSLPLAPWEAALGAAVSVRTLEGPARIQVPPGSSTGRRIRMRERGYPGRGGARGDLYAEIRIIVPSSLSAEERKLYEELSKVSPNRPRPEEDKA